MQKKQHEAAMKYSVLGANIWRWKQQKQKFRNVNSIWKFFNVPKHGCFHEDEEQVVQFVSTQRQNGLPVSHNIKVRAREIMKMLPVNTAYQEFEVSMG
jgi:hypothetical protein